MKTSVHLSAETEQLEEVLELPQGRLMVGDLMATFSPEAVLKAAEEIRNKLDHECAGDPVTFTSQAGVIVYAAKECGYNGDPEYKTL